MAVPGVDRPQMVLQQVAFFGGILPAVLAFTDDRRFGQALLLSAAAGALAGPANRVVFRQWQPDISSPRAAAVLTGGLAVSVTVLTELVTGQLDRSGWATTNALLVGALFGGIFYLFGRRLWDPPATDGTPTDDAQPGSYNSSGRAQHP